LLVRELGHCHQTRSSTAARPARAGMSHDPEAPKLEVSFRGPQNSHRSYANSALPDLHHHVK